MTNATATNPFKPFTKCTVRFDRRTGSSVTAEVGHPSIAAALAEGGFVTRVWVVDAPRHSVTIYANPAGR